MTPLSEAAPELKAKVVALTGECSCREDIKAENAWLGRKNNWRRLRDPSCLYHRAGEHFANLIRENERLRRALAQANHHKQLRKAS